jgi:hypothetical protein
MEHVRPQTAHGVWGAYAREWEDMQGSGRTCKGVGEGMQCVQCVIMSVIHQLDPLLDKLAYVAQPCTTSQQLTRSTSCIYGLSLNSKMA